MSRKVNPGSGPDVAPLPGNLPFDALDDRIALVGTSGSGKTYATKGLVERLLVTGARMCIVDPLGVWWGLRSAADGKAAGFPVIVFGGRHADVPITEAMGATLGKLIATQTLACVVDVSELGSGAARKRFMSAFAEAIYEANTEPLHLILDEADLWAPQKPQPDQSVLLGRIEEIVRRGRVRGFIPWLITQRPAVVAKDVLSQADVLVAMKLTSRQDRDAMGGWIEGQADREIGKRILADLPRLATGEGFVWAPSYGILERASFPPISTFDSSRTPKRGDKPRTTTPSLAEVDLSAITAALAVEEEKPAAKAADGRALTKAQEEIFLLKDDLAAVRADLVAERSELADARRRLAEIGQLAGGKPRTPFTAERAAGVVEVNVGRIVTTPIPKPSIVKSDGALPGAARKLLATLAQHSPGRYTWRQAATLAGLKAQGGHFNNGRKALREAGLIEEEGDLVRANAAGIAEAGEVPASPATPAETLALWCSKLPSPAPEILRVLAAAKVDMPLDTLAARIGKAPRGGYWNGGIAVLRNNALVEIASRRIKIAPIFLEA